MKGITVLLFLLMGLSQTVNASEWSTEDIVLEATFLSLLFIDYRQTITNAEDPFLREGNIFLGEEPSRSEIDRYFIGVGIAHLLISNFLSLKWRMNFQYFTVGVELQTVLINHSLGIKAKF